MADNVAITAGSGTTIAADELTDATLGSVKVQYTKLMDGTLDGTAKAKVAASGSVAEGDSVLGVQAPVLGATTGTAVVSDANGTLQQYLRGIIKQFATWFGTAGSPGANVASVQGVAGGTPQPVVGSIPLPVGVEITRPADTTAYAANDSVNTSTSSPTFIDFSTLTRVNGGSAYVVAIRLTTNQKSIIPRFRVHLFNDNTVTLANDNAPWEEKYADVGKRQGYWDLPAMITGADTTNSDMSRTLDLTVRIPVVATGSSQHIYAALETLDAFTPTSGEKFTLTLTVDLN